jgi:hypothetical protein
MDSGKNSWGKCTVAFDKKQVDRLSDVWYKSVVKGVVSAAAWHCQHTEDVLSSGSA